MEYGAIDLHKRESQVRIITGDGEVLDRRILTTRDRFTVVFWGRPQTRILLEASTESEWVAQHLESLGHEVIVAIRIMERCMLGAADGSKNGSARCGGAGGQRVDTVITGRPIVDPHGNGWWQSMPERPPGID